jgi:hypothetical protein
MASATVPINKLNLGKTMAGGCSSWPSELKLLAAVVGLSLDPQKQERELS